MDGANEIIRLSATLGEVVGELKGLSARFDGLAREFAGGDEILRAELRNLQHTLQHKDAAFGNTVRLLERTADLLSTVQGRLDGLERDHAATRARVDTVERTVGELSEVRSRIMGGLVVLGLLGVSVGGMFAALTQWLLGKFH
jgi:hypothetical protein